MAFNLRILTIITGVWFVGVASMAAFAFTSGPVASPIPVVKDVQVGERGNQTRIVLVCDGGCAVEKRGNEDFILRGAHADLALDLSDRVDNISSLTAISNEDGARISINARRSIAYVNTKSCTIGGQTASCIDLFFDEADALATPVQTYEPGEPAAEPHKEASASEKNGDATTIATNESAQNSMVASPPATVTEREAAAPALREVAPERFTQFAALSPPERLAPPTAILAKVQPVRAEEIPPTKIETPTMRTERMAPPRVRDYRSSVQSILGKSLTTDYCNEAIATLQDDAWALDAMVDVGLCAGARGDMTGAEDILSRLLEYTPDNYQAHVGRALIAVEVGEKSVAKRYFQDALTALPPIEESNRIVQAMNRL